MNYQELKDEEARKVQSRYRIGFPFGKQAWHLHIKLEEELRLLYGGNIVLNRDFKYRNRATPLEVRCHKCQHNWSVLYVTLVTNKAGCPNCRKLSKTIRP